MCRISAIYKKMKILKSETWITISISHLSKVAQSGVGDCTAFGLTQQGCT